MSIATTPSAAPAAATPGRTSPATASTGRYRDQFIDVLRVAAIVAVVAQHWLMPVLSYDNGRLSAGNALTTDGAWAITWISQVMPLVFFAGGAAAAMSLRRRYVRLGQGPATSSAWLADRVRRLSLPVLPLAAVWLPLPHLLTGLGVPVQPVAAGAHVAGQLLWFLAAYVLVTSLTAPALRAHDRWRGAEMVILAAGAVAVDVVRFTVAGGAGGTSADVLGYLNVVFVWAAIYQAGIMYASGGLDRLRGRTAWLTAAAGYGAAALMVAFGPYPPSMIGMPGAPMSNMNPPTAVLLAIAVGQLGLALALRRGIERWASSAPVAHAVTVLSRRLMTIYVWHTPALVAVAGVAVVGLGIDTPAPFSEPWREQMGWWLLSLFAVLAVLTQVFGRYERSPSPTAHARPGRVVAASTLVGLGLLTLTLTGFGPLDGQILQLDAPLAGSLAVVVGTALLRIHQVPGSVVLEEHGRLKA